MATFTRKTAIIRLAKVQFDNVDFGLISDVKLTFKPLELGRDAFGRTVTSLYDLKLELNIMANDNASMKELFTISRDHGTGTVYIYGYGGDVQIQNVLLRIEPEINFDGKASKIKVIFDRYIKESEAISLWLLTETLNSPSIETIVDGNNPPSSSFLKIES